MLEIVSRKFKASQVSQELVSLRNAVTQNFNKCFINTWQNNFYKSNENRLRSLSVYYSHNVMGKNKYRAVRKSNQNSLFQNKRLANYFPYKELAKFISSLDIGTLLPFSPHLIETHEVKNIPAGLYRDVKSYIQRLAIFYLKVNKYRADKLLTFGNFSKKDSSSFLFLISFGGDGAPGIGTIFNVSFLNVG